MPYVNSEIVLQLWHLVVGGAAAVLVAGLVFWVGMRWERRKPVLTPEQQETITSLSRFFQLLLKRQPSLTNDFLGDDKHIYEQLGKDVERLQELLLALRIPHEVMSPAESPPHSESRPVDSEKVLAEANVPELLANGPLSEPAIEEVGTKLEQTVDESRTAAKEADKQNPDLKPKRRRKSYLDTPDGRKRAEAIEDGRWEEKAYPKEWGPPHFPPDEGGNGQATMVIGQSPQPQQ